MKNKSYSLQVLLILFWVAVSCNSVNPEPQKTVVELIQNKWKAIHVNYNNNSVYTEGSTTNSMAGYANYRLDLSDPSTAQLTEFEGSTFNGQWELNSTNTVLIIKNLSPAPSSTNGTLEYSIDTIEEGKLEIIKTTTSAKTGNNVVQYTLISE